MSDQLVPLSPSTPPLVLAVDRARTYLASARARNTIQGYRASFRLFERWCQAFGVCSLPATNETIALYLSENAGRLKASTLAHHLAAISKAHEAAGYPSPTKDDLLVAETLKGIKRIHGSALSQRAPILTEDLRVMLRLVRPGRQGVRDRALLLVGFAGAFRRSELVALDVADLQFQPEGLLITIRRSKTDQEGVGRSVAIPHGAHSETCPVSALLNWLREGFIDAGPVFRPVRKGGRLALVGSLGMRSRVS